MADRLLTHLLRRFHLEHMAVTALLGLLCALLVVGGALSSFDRRLYDTLSASVPAEPHPDILIVAIDDFSLRQLGRWPWDRAVHAALLERLHEYGARAVLCDYLIAEPDLARPDSDQLLADALAQHGRVYLPVNVEQLRGSQPVEGLPWRQFAEQAHRLGHVDLVSDSDGVVRSLWLRSGVGQAFWPHIGLAVLEDEQPQLARQYQRRQPGDSTAMLNVREHQRRIPFNRYEYPRVSAADLIDGRVPAELLKGRVVLIGATAEVLGDTFKTPLHADMRMPGVEIHARVLDALLQQRLISDVSLAGSVLLSLLIALLALLLLPLCRSGWGLLLIIGLSGAALLLSVALLHANLWWSPAAVLVTVLVTGPLWGWRRLEYSFYYLHRTVARIIGSAGRRGRLLQPISMGPLMQMLAVLPVRAWRLESRAGASLQVGGDQVEDTSWQGQAARHYPFRRGQEEFELALLWRQPALAEQLDDTVKAMLSRVSIPAPPRTTVLRSVTQFVDRVSAADRRQRGLSSALHTALTQLDEGVLVADICGEVLLANDQLLAFLEMERQPLGAWHVLDLARELRLESNQWAELVSEAVIEGQAQTELVGRHGESWLVSLRCIDAGSQVGQVLLLQLSDITAQVRVQRTREELLHFLSHDLRSPMISILALTEKMRHSPNSTSLPNFLDQLDVHARRNLGVAEQFLQLIRLESMLYIEMIELDMLPVVESAVEQVQEQAQAAEVSLRVDYRDEDQVWVRGNHELLTRLLINLLSNAVRHSVPGSSIDVRLYSHADEVRCEVRDRGAGIALDRQALLFSQLQEGGKGLGLRFVELVARRHGGRMLLESQPAAGSRFTLALPVLLLDEL